MRGANNFVTYYSLIFSADSVAWISSIAFLSVSSCFRFHSVEFPAVLVDLSTKSVVSEFHQFVQPQENYKLSSFCTKLTGITQV